MPYSPKRILTVVGCFGLQLAISCVFWDHYISEYHELLEVHSPHIDPHDQSEVLRSSLMWIIMYFWRVSNAHSLMHFFLFFVFTDHMWDFLLWIQYIGLVNIGVLVAFTELHLRSVSAPVEVTHEQSPISMQRLSAYPRLLGLTGDSHFAGQELCAVNGSRMSRKPKARSESEQ